MQPVYGDAKADLGVDLLAPPSAGGRVFCLHLLTEIVLWNVDRLSLIWPRVQSGLFEVIREASKPSFRVELACVGMCRIFAKVCLFSYSPLNGD